MPVIGEIRAPELGQAVYRVYQGNEPHPWNFYSTYEQAVQISTTYHNNNNLPEVSRTNGQTRTHYSLWNLYDGVTSLIGHTPEGAPIDPVEGSIFHPIGGIRYVFIAGAWRHPSDTPPDPNLPTIAVGFAEPLMATGVLTIQGNDSSNQIHLDPTAGSLNIGAAAVILAPGPTPPLNPPVGGMYYNTHNESLYLYTGNAWMQMAAVEAVGHQETAAPADPEVVKKEIEAGIKARQELREYRKRNRFDHIIDEVS